MKANEAPEKLYLMNYDGGIMLSYDPLTKFKYGDRYDYVDEEVFPIEEGCEVEYTRTDAFIEKACSWLKEIFSEYENLTDYNPTEDFRNYMKGEQV